MDLNKTVLSICVMLILAIFPSGQAAAQVMIGSGSYYGAEEGFGLNLNAHYPLRNQINIGLDLVWWPRSAPDNARYIFTEANVELQYIPIEIYNLRISVSALTGYHYAGARLETLGESYTTSDHMTAFGVGAGIAFDFGAFSLNTGVRKFIYTGFNQLSAGAGVQIGI